MIFSHTISVIIPTFNRAKTIARSMDSVLLQTFSPMEIIVVDDGSTDDTMTVMQNYRDTRIKYLRLASNQGAQNARIRGIQESQGDFLAFLDSDDEWSKDSLEIRLTSFFAAGFSEGLIYGDAAYRGAKNISFHFKKLSGIEYRYLLKELSLCPFSVMMISRSCFVKCGLPSADFPSWQDDDMVLTVGKLFPVHHCGSVVAIMHRSPSSISLNKHAIYHGCQRIVSKYANDIKQYRGYFRLLLWELRVANSLIASKISTNRSMANEHAPLIMLKLPFLLLSHKMLKVFLRLFFERVDF